MEVKIRNELIIINFLVIALILIVTLLPYNILRIIIGLPFLLFFPGYTMIAALFPKKTGISEIERVALSFGLSISVVPLIGLLLNYTPWGIKVEPALYAVSLLIFLVSIVAWFRRRRLPEPERFVIRFDVKAFDRNGGTAGKALSVILAVFILVALGTLGYFVAFPHTGEKFSEFYILGLSGNPADYPSKLRVGQTASVIVGIINHEQKTTNYRVEVRLNGNKNNEAGPISLKNEDKWEQKVSFTPGSAGNNQKVEFLLFKDNEEVASLETHLWIDVIQ